MSALESLSRSMIVGSGCDWAALSLSESSTSGSIIAWLRYTWSGLTTVGFIDISDALYWMLLRPYESLLILMFFSSSLPLFCNACEFDLLVSVLSYGSWGVIFWIEGIETDFWLYWRRLPCRLLNEPLVIKICLGCWLDLLAIEIFCWLRLLLATESDLADECEWWML